MSSSQPETGHAVVRKVIVTADSLVVDLVDGRRFSVPVSWYPRLAHGTPDERTQWELISQGEGIHWPLLDEDIHVADLIAGRASNESKKSISKWLSARTAG